MEPIGGLQVSGVLTLHGPCVGVVVLQCGEEQRNIIVYSVGNRSLATPARLAVASTRVAAYTPAGRPSDHRTTAPPRASPPAAFPIKANDNTDAAPVRLPTAFSEPLAS